MIRYVEAKILDRTYILFLSISAMFEVRDRFGEEALDTVQSNDVEAIDVAFKIFGILARHGDKLAKQYGMQSNSPVFDSEYLEFMDPTEFDKMKLAIFYTFNVGLGTEVPDLTENGGEQDLILKQIDAMKSKKKD